MKIKTSELTGYALGWAVSLITNPDWEHDDRLGNVQCLDEDSYDPQDNWAQGGPIIEREQILVAYDHDHDHDHDHDSGQCEAATYIDDELEMMAWGSGGTYLIAAMRCYVASQLGDEVDIPEELT